MSREFSPRTDGSTGAQFCFSAMVDHRGDPKLVISATKMVPMKISMLDN